VGRRLAGGPGGRWGPHGRGPASHPFHSCGRPGGGWGDRRRGPKSRQRAGGGGLLHHEVWAVKASARWRRRAPARWRRGRGRQGGRAPGVATREGVLQAAPMPQGRTRRAEGAARLCLLEMAEPWRGAARPGGVKGVLTVAVEDSGLRAEAAPAPSLQLARGPRQEGRCSQNPSKCSGCVQCCCVGRLFKCPAAAPHWGVQAGQGSAGERWAGSRVPRAAGRGAHKATPH
jgi:hypothetical protein